MTINIEESITKFEETLKTIQNFDRTYFNQNKKTIKTIAKTINIHFLQKGKYDPIENSITINNISQNVLYSSTFYDENTNYLFSGFTCPLTNNHKSYYLGIGIDEAYTEILTKRYFNKGALDTTPLECTYTLLLEEIVGKEKMQELYSKADLPGLIDELSNYQTEDEIIAFLTSMDHVYNYIHQENNVRNNKDILKENIQTIKHFLITCYANKTINLNPEIDKESYYKIINQFYKKVSTNTTIGKKTLKTTNPEYLNNKIYEIYINNKNKKNQNNI